MTATKSAIAANNLSFKHY